MPGAKVNTDAHGEGPRYRNFSTSNKALDGLVFNPLSKTLPKIDSHTFTMIPPLFNQKLLYIEPADRAWFMALNIAVRTQEQTLCVTSRLPPAFRFARLSTYDACCFRRRVDSVERTEDASMGSGR